MINSGMKENKNFSWYYEESKKGFYLISTVLGLSVTFIPEIGLSVGKVDESGLQSFFFVDIFGFKLGFELVDYKLDTYTLQSKVIFNDEKIGEYFDAANDFSVPGYTFGVSPFTWLGQ